jgi:recombinational DNA repair protein (RecF pathway)
MNADNFFNATHCDRCKIPLSVRTTSWFTEETICMDCSDKERLIREKLHKLGKGDMEGCGYIPKV